jgi:hypothetical protein
MSVTCRRVNAGEKTHWLAGLKMHHVRGQAGTGERRTFPAVSTVAG